MLLKQQLDGHRRVQEQLRTCQQEVGNAMKENEKLKEKMRLHEVELTQQKTMVNRVSTEPPFMKHTISNVEATSFSQPNLIAELWNWESRNPVPKNIFQMFEVQCQFFLLVTSLQKSVWIDHNQFLRIWKQSVEWKVENMFVEILARRQIKLSYPYSAFIVIGDLGARILLYYASL